MALLPLYIWVDWDELLFPYFDLSWLWEFLFFYTGEENTTEVGNILVVEKMIQLVAQTSSRKLGYHEMLKELIYLCVSFCYTTEDQFCATVLPSASLYHMLLSLFILCLTLNNNLSFVISHLASILLILRLLSLTFPFVTRYTFSIWKYSEKDSKQNRTGKSKWWNPTASMSRVV